MKNDLVKLRHARSTKDFPGLKLEDNEFVELVIRRSKIGLILIWAGMALGCIILLAALFLIMQGGDGNALFRMDNSAKSFLYLIVYVLLGVLIIAGLIGTRVYRGNELIITNKRLVQKSTASLFSSSTNIIDLVSVEDVSFRQAGIIEYIFKLGTIRMSTVGNETTYTFKYADTLSNELETITHLVHVEKEKTKESYARDRARAAREQVQTDTISLPSPE